MLEKNDSSLGNNKVGDNQISSFKVSLKSAPKDDEPEAIENEENYLITRNSVGNIKFGMTVGEAKKILKGSTFGSVPVGEGEGAEIGLFVDEKLRLTIGYWEEPEPQIDSAGVILGYKLPPINENQKITWISINDPRYKTAEGVHLGMKIAEAEKHYGKPILTQTAISHVWEIGKFTNQPKYLSFGFKSNDVYDSVGIYGDTPNCGDEYEPECRKTNKYNPGSYISAMSISTPQND